MVSHFARIAPTSRLRYPRMRALGFSSAPDVLGAFRIAMPITGAKVTATSHDVISAIATTAKIENVYSPAELLAKPIGTKPAIVISVPISIGAASVL